MALAEDAARDALAEALEALADALAEPTASVGDAAAADEAALLIETGGADVRATEGGAVGDDAQTEGAGSASALLTPARTPMTPRAAVLPIRPIRKVRD